MSAGPGDRLEVARRVVSQPTAPLREHLTAAAVEAVAADLGLPSRRDAAGNVVVGRGRRWVLCAHLDHPAFWTGGGRLEFKGGVRAGVAVPGSAVLLHRDGDADPVGRAVLVEVDEEGGRLRSATAELVDGEMPDGGFAVWDVPGWRLDGDRVTARACDDLVGVVAGLCALAEAGDQHACLVATRAEEVGFLGAFEAARLGTVPAGAAVVSLECSRMLASAPQGAGAIVRVGDLTSIFSPRLTATVWHRRPDGVPAVRRLMDGGTCEATAFAHLGFEATGVCVALAGYHNQPDDPDAGGPVPESILVADLHAEVDLLAAVVAEPPAPAPPGRLAALVDEATAELARHPL